MALKLSDQYSNTTPPTEAYPQGSAKNETTQGALNGTPWEKAIIDDIQGLLQSLLAAAGTVPSGSADSVVSPQYLSSIFNLRYFDKVNYKVGTKVVASSGVEYRCVQPNGPDTVVRNPIADPLGEYWITERARRFLEDNPVGTIRMSGKSAHGFPAGTWTRIRGRYIVGVDEDDKTWNQGNMTLGNKSHSHGSGTYKAASHTHGSGSLSAASHSHGSGSLSVIVTRDGWGETQTSGGLPSPSVSGRLVTGSGETEASEKLESLGHATINKVISASGSTASALTDVGGSTSSASADVAGTSQSQTHLPPTIAKYIWERTA